MPEPFFLYHEDVDLSLRVRLAGGELGVEPGARVDHDYDFDKGATKWRYLERNRWATLIRTYPARAAGAARPGAGRDRARAARRGRRRRLAAAEAARLGRDAGARCRACSASAGAIQAARTIGAGEFADGLTASLDSAYLGRAGRSRALAVLLGAYWSLVRMLVGAGRG